MINSSRHCACCFGKERVLFSCRFQNSVIPFVAGRVVLLVEDAESRLVAGRWQGLI
jgi:hypothetical protein